MNHTAINNNSRDELLRKFTISNEIFGEVNFSKEAHSIQLESKKELKLFKIKPNQVTKNKPQSSGGDSSPSAKSGLKASLPTSTTSVTNSTSGHKSSSKNLSSTTISDNAAAVKSSEQHNSDQAHTNKTEAPNLSSNNQTQISSAESRFGKITTEISEYGTKQMVIEGHASVIKTNYVKDQTLAGKHANSALTYGDNHGSTSKSKSIAQRALGSQMYMDRSTALSEQLKEQRALESIEKGKELTNTFGQDGHRLSKDELKSTRDEMSGASGFRRVIFSPNPEFKLSHDEMKTATLELMNNWREQTGKDFSFTFAIHDDQSQMHSHILMVAYDSRANDINMGSKQLSSFKTHADIALDRQLDLRIELERVMNQDYEVEIKLEHSHSLENTIEPNLDKDIDRSIETSKEPLHNEISPESSGNNSADKQEEKQTEKQAELELEI